MSRATSKEFQHLQEWLSRAQEIVEAGQDAYNDWTGVMLVSRQRVEWLNVRQTAGTL